MIQRLRVSFRFCPSEIVPVGEMLRSESGHIYFQFSETYPKSLASPSPFKLKLIAEPQSPSPADSPIFDGLFGVFADSLPDGWGLLMMSRAMRRQGIDFKTVSALDRLAFLGSKTMGALVYEPELASHHGNEKNWDLSRIANDVDRVIQGHAEEVLPILLDLGGSPGGARPKILIGLQHASKAKKRILLSGVEDLSDNFEHWMLKFRGQDESSESSILEYIYFLTARHVGLEMMDSELIEDKDGRKWFATKRFDRESGNKRIHTHTVAGLLHADFRMPSMDYEDVLKLTRILTKNEDDVLSMYRQACFNVIFHNRDDHVKNFSFKMSRQGIWRLAPCYDLTYTHGPAGEHTTAILGEGMHPTKDLCLELARRVGIKAGDSRQIWGEVEEGKSFMKAQIKKYKLKFSPV